MSPAPPPPPRKPRVQLPTAVLELPHIPSLDAIAPARVDFGPRPFARSSTPPASRRVEGTSPGFPAPPGAGTPVPPPPRVVRPPPLPTARPQPFQDVEADTGETSESRELIRALWAAYGPLSARKRMALIELAKLIDRMPDTDAERVVAFAEFQAGAPRK